MFIWLASVPTQKRSRLSARSFISDRDQELFELIIPFQSKQTGPYGAMIWWECWEIVRWCFWHHHHFFGTQRLANVRSLITKEMTLHWSLNVNLCWLSPLQCWFVLSSCFCVFRLCVGKWTETTDVVNFFVNELIWVSGTFDPVF
jgi:hypothetical protein